MMAIANSECKGNKHSFLYVQMTIIAVSSCVLSFSILSESTLHDHSIVTEVFAQPYVQTVKHRDLTLDLGNGTKTNAQLTIPAVGEGPFPGSSFYRVLVLSI